MKYWKLLRACLVSSAMLLGLTGCVDQSGPAEAEETEEIEEEELSIVTTSVAIAEILDALEVDSVTGIPTTESELPERYEGVEEVGTPMSPDMEILAAMKPDWIFSPVSLEEDLAEQYENLGISSAFFNLNSTAGMFQSIEDLGEMLDKEEEAEALSAEFTEFMAEYAERNNGKESPRVLILMGMPGSYVVATENSYVGSLVQLAGGTNVYEGESEDSFLTINPEDMVEKEPDMILLTAHALPDQVAEMFEEEFAENDIWQHFKAVEEDKVYSLNDEYFGMSANFGYQDALTDLEELFFPDDQEEQTEE